MGCSASVVECPKQVKMVPAISEGEAQHACNHVPSKMENFQDIPKSQILVEESTPAARFGGREKARSLSRSQTSRFQASFRITMYQNQQHPAASKFEYKSVLGSNSPQHKSSIIKGKGRSKQGSERFSVDTPPNFAATPMAGKQGKPVKSEHTVLFSFGKHSVEGTPNQSKFLPKGQCDSAGFQPCDGPSWFRRSNSATKRQGQRAATSVQPVAIRVQPTDAVINIIEQNRSSLQEQHEPVIEEPISRLGFLGFDSPDSGDDQLSAIISRSEGKSHQSSARSLQMNLEGLLESP